MGFQNKRQQPQPLTHLINDTYHKQGKEAAFTTNASYFKEQMKTVSFTTKYWNRHINSQACQLGMMYSRAR